VKTVSGKDIIIIIIIILLEVDKRSCEAFIGLTLRANSLVGLYRLYLKFWIKLTALGRNRRFSISFRS